MTYQDLLDVLNDMSKEHLETTVTYYSDHTDEYYPVTDLTFTVGGDDVLDDDHPILITDTKSMYQ